MASSTQFARTYVPWIEEWARMKLSGTQMRVLLLLISRMEPDGNGGWVAWYPRDEMAELLGLSEVTVRNTLTSLKEKGAIKTLRAAHRGWCQRYQIMPKIKVHPYSKPNQEKGSATEVRKGLPEQCQRVTSTADPLRKARYGASASLSQPSAEEEERRRRYAERIAGIV